MRTALIIEDEKYSADRLKKLVEDHTSLSIIDTLYSVESAKDWFQLNDMPETIFLDIQLGDGTGFDILDFLEDQFPCIIFTTAFDQYTLKAFKYNSIDYLLKPIKPQELIEATNKLKKLSSNDLSVKIESLRKDLIKDFKTKFLIKTGLKFKSVSVSDIAYFYSESGTSYIMTQKGDNMIVDMSLDQIEIEVDPKHFFRINRHMIVNENSIKEIDSFFNGRLILDVVPKQDEATIVSRDKVKHFKSWLDN
jgi:two-component system response regulator LytT